MKWLAFYTEGRVYSSHHTPWTELPDTGVLVVNRYHGTGKTVYSGYDWYWLEDGNIHGVSSGEWGTWQPKPDVSCASCIKQGVGVSDEEFDRVYELMWMTK
jgi:hypothetical protein